MEEQMSRRTMLGLTAATMSGVTALTASAQASTGEYQEPAPPEARSAHPEPERPYWEASYSGGPPHAKPLAPGRPGKDYRPVVVPTGYTLPWKVVGGVKVFHVIAEEVDHAFDAGLRAKCWAYNGHVNSTVIEAVEGERVRIYVTNRLSVATSVHWHGIYLPNGMDGVGGLTQPYIKPGETAKYEFTLRQHGTFMVHSHHDEMTQMGMGMIGMFVIHPRNPAPAYRVDRDFAIMLSEWDIPVGTARPNTLEMTDFNVLTMNGKVFPSTGPLVCKTGDKVRIRLGNLGAMDHHPIHIHGYHFRVTADRRRGHPALGAVAGDDGARRGRPDAHHRVHRRCPRRLGFPLPHDAPRHEPDGPQVPEHGGGEARGSRRTGASTPPRLHDHGPHGYGHGADGRGDADAAE